MDFQLDILIHDVVLIVITIMNMRYLAEIAGDRLIVNALSPGGVKTGPAERVFKGILKVLFK